MQSCVCLLGFTSLQLLIPVDVGIRRGYVENLDSFLTWGILMSLGAFQTFKDIN